MGTRVQPGDIVKVNGRAITSTNEKPVYIALNKPIGIVCTTDTRREKNNIIEFINYPQRIFPIGRLDKPSEGLILLTSDGDIVNKILRAHNAHEKEYVVSVDKPITKDFLRKMSTGVEILDTVTKPCKIFRQDQYTFTIVLTQGLNRQIRRMCEALGYHVSRLKRVRIMNISLDLPVGQWRHLTEKELSTIKRLVEHSTKTSPYAKSNEEETYDE
jgi:23S rRNA pseudouridine2604 synthase